MTQNTETPGASTQSLCSHRSVVCTLVQIIIPTVLALGVMTPETIDDGGR